MTASRQIADAEALALELAELPRVTSTKVDDWNNDGDFNIFVNVCHTVDGVRGLMARVYARIRKYGYLEWYDGPKRCYTQIDGRKRFSHYDRSDYKLSVHIYDRTPEPPPKEPQYACRADMPAES